MKIYNNLQLSKYGDLNMVAFICNYKEHNIGSEIILKTSKLFTMFRQGKASTEYGVGIIHSKESSELVANRKWLSIQKDIKI